MLRKLLSLPPNLVNVFHQITGYDKDEWFCTCDPVGHRLGSGGGTDWLLRACYEYDHSEASFDQWLASERRLLLHAGGQSRRLPSYAPSGKILTPIPVYRWERGQRLSQDLLSLQVPLYQKIMDAAPSSVHTMIVSGDVLIRATQPLQPIPDADVICYGLWLSADIAKDHGVFVSSRETPDVLKCMLQKPSVETLSQLSEQHLYLTDIGVWLLSDKAVKLLMDHSEKEGEIVNYDLYGEFGCALGTDPGVKDTALNELKVVVLPLPGGEFYHFGTSHELLSSTLAIQNLVNDQREIMHHSNKPHPAMFVQNAVIKVKITSENKNLWAENCWIGAHWHLSRENIITGVPENDWHISLDEGQCVDIVPIADNQWVVRPYHYYDKFAGSKQQEPLFPVTDNVEDMGTLLRYMLQQDTSAQAAALYQAAPKLSAEQISDQANLPRLVAQRSAYRQLNWPALAANYQHSVFYQVDLDDAAQQYATHQLPMPDPLPDNQLLLTRVHDAMFRSAVAKYKGEDAAPDEQRAFALLREGLTQDVICQKQQPRIAVYSDQIVWGRSPVRIDLAGGWTDTPPYCLMEGGNVVNVAIELNGQPPLQVYVKPCAQPHLILRSIDLGASETITTYEQLSQYNKVGSPFSIPKAALALAGFLPAYSVETFSTLTEQLQSYGHGIELTMLSAIPAGSGLGTSSILAATVLGALSDFCGLGWDKTEIGRRTLVLEQLLTTGGGWQDQFGGLLPGIKLLQTQKGFTQTPIARWLPTDIFTQPEYHACHLLYYTGITRTAKSILAEIVRRMFLNQHEQLALLREMKDHALALYDAVQQMNFNEMGRLIRTTWKQNQLLDSGTNPAEVAQLTKLVDDYCLGYKLPGAGGGGYLYMMAKDPEAAARIKQVLMAHPLHDNARFVDMSVSETGLKVSRS